MADTMLPAAPVTTTTESGPRARAGVGRRGRPFLEADGEAQRAPAGPSRRPGVASVSATSAAATSAGPDVDVDVDDLHHRVGSLPGQRLGEAAHGTGHGAAGTRFVVAVGAAVAGGGDQERAPPRPRRS